MANRALPTPRRSIGKSLLLTLPILLWSLLMFSRTMMQPGRAVKLAAVVTLFFTKTIVYIDDGDLPSKDTFALLGYIFAIQAGEVKGSPPTLVLPVSK